MSPEQAEMNQLDIDTRSDIYSLGVLLYELLTGSTPITKKQLREAGFMEMLRVIRESEPAKPSTRLSTSSVTLPTVSTQRSTEPAKLGGLMRGELDWIVMKSLEKDRSRRYATASDLARDIQRHLDDEPVEACPPSRLYLFKKSLRRNAKKVAAVTIVIVAMLTAVLAYRTEARRANLRRRMHASNCRRFRCGWMSRGSSWSRSHAKKSRQNGPLVRCAEQRDRAVEGK